MEQEINSYLLEFTAPSGFKYTIREQNGEDDDILSNPVEAQSLLNISRFVSGIVVSTDRTSNGKLTVEQAHGLPALDKYCILFNSRIHSLGNEIEFQHDWGKENGGIVNYSQDLNEFLFDYSKEPTEEELLTKPNAIPYYPEGKLSTDIPIKLSTGKELKFDLLNAVGEAYVLNLPLEKRTKNQEYVARNLCLNVDGKWDKVTSFRMFSVREMLEIKKHILSIDPIFTGTTTIENPSNSMVEEISIVAIKDFFYPGEI